MKLDDLLIEQELTRLVDDLLLLEVQLDPDIGGIKIEKCIGINRSFFANLMKMPIGTRASYFDNYVAKISPRVYKHMQNRTPCGEELLKFKARIDKSNDLDVIFSDTFANSQIKKPTDELPKCHIDILKHSVNFITNNVDKMMKYLVKKGHLANPNVKKAIQELYIVRNKMKKLTLHEAAIADLSDCGGNAKFKILEQLRILKINLLKVIAALKMKAKDTTKDINTRNAAIDDSRKLAAITKSL